MKNSSILNCRAPLNPLKKHLYVIKFVHTSIITVVYYT